MNRPRITSLALPMFLSMTAYAQASPITIEFRAGLANAGGSVTLFADGNLGGFGIPIGDLAITGAPSGNGDYVVDGSATDVGGSTFGSLSFSTGGLAGTNFIDIAGFLPSKPGFSGIGSSAAPVELMSGTFSDFSLDAALTGFVGIGAATDAALMAHIGLADDTQFTFDARMTIAAALSAANPTASAINAAIVNTAASTVPEPSAIVLLASGLFGVRKALRRHAGHIARR